MRRPVTRLCVAVTLLVALWCSQAPVTGQSTTLYVNNSGSPACSDATTKASNTASSPWCTIGRAAWGSTNRAAPNASQAAAAGDTVLITPGTYDVTWSPGGGPLTNILYDPVNVGTAGNPIRFRASTGARCAIVITNGGTGGPYIGGDNADYVEWAGFSFTESTAPTIPDTGPAVFFGADHSRIEDSCFTGNPNWTFRVGDNYNAIRVQSTQDIVIRNNTITDYGGDTNDENHSGITTYTVKDIVVEHNVMTNNGTGFYQKGMDNTQSPGYVGAFTTRYNRISGGSQGIRVLYVPSTNAAPNLIYGNVITDCDNSGIMLQNTSSEPATARYAIIVNNTIVNCVLGFEVGGAPLENEGHQFWNNVIHFTLSGTREALFYNNSSLGPTFIDFEHNAYFGFSTFLNKPDPNLTLAQWQSTHSQDSATPAAINSNPLFANLAGGDYRPCTGAGVPHASCSGASPVLSHGRAQRGVGGSDGTTIPAGAYITGTEQIGLTTSDSGLPARLPAGLRWKAGWLGTPVGPRMTACHGEESARCGSEHARTRWRRGRRS